MRKSAQRRQRRLYRSMLRHVMRKVWYVPNGGGGMETPARISDAGRKLLIGRDSDCGVPRRDSGEGVRMKVGVSDWGEAVPAWG